MEQLATSIFQEAPTEAFTVVLFYTLLALEWEIDPKATIDLLPRDDGSPD